MYRTGYRKRQLLKYVETAKSGIEVAPYYTPTVSRREGYNVVSLDIFDGDELRRRAAVDPNISDAAAELIEDVDLTGSAVDIADLVAAKFGDKRFDYILSSHNFEHLPDPIRFLQGCEKVLAPGGVLSLAVPDRRFNFDFFRPATELSEWLDAYNEKRQRPTPGQHFRGQVLRSSLDSVRLWEPKVVAHRPIPAKNLDAAYATWQSSVQDTDPDYVDAHCSVFTPASLELMLADLNYLGVIRLEILEVSQTHIDEFFVHLRNSSDSKSTADTDAYYRRRARLLRRAASECGKGPTIGLLKSVPVIARELTVRLCDNLRRTPN